MDVILLYLEFIRATSISITDLTSSWCAVCEACSLFKEGDNIVDCVNAHYLHRLTCAVLKTPRLTCIKTYSLLQSVKSL